MPGVAGILNAGTGSGSLTRIGTMVQRMAHQPSFATGELVQADRGIAAGWVAFPGSFADCAPAWNEDRTVCLIFAGEEVSTADRVAGLKGRGHEVSENAAALVHLYEELGPKFLRELNGRFCGLLIDLQREFAILFNDRFGLSRIYYHEDPAGFFFASEAKALLAAFPQLREFDQQGLAEFFSVGCVMQNRTLFRDIALLPPGSQWTFHRDGRVEKARYFAPSEWEGQDPLSEKDYSEALQSVFSQVAPRYSRGGLATGMSLTGGLDSRMLLAWTQANAGSLPCYTFGGPYRDCWDVKLARELAKVVGQPHTTIRIEEDFFREFPQLAEQSVYLSDGAMDVTGSVELYANRKARAIAPVRLTGNYGSEILRSNVAFRPGKVDRSLFTPEFAKLIDQAEETYRAEANCPRLSFITFKQVPWHHYGRFSIEQSQLIPRSPFLDNDVVGLAFRVPTAQSTSARPLLELISAGNSRLDQVRTDRSLARRPWPVLSGIAQKWQEFTAKAEYAYDYGMPQRLVQVDRLLAPLHLERLFLGRHKFYHFRSWYKRELRNSVETAALNTEPSCYRKGLASQAAKAHLEGRKNQTLELHKLLTVQMVERNLFGQ